MATFTTIALIALAVTAVILTGVAIFLSSKADEIEEPPVRWEVESYSEAPPAPIFSQIDSKACRAEVEDMYGSAVSSLESSQDSDDQLNSSYQQILDRQKKYGIELVNNLDFELWTISDWRNSWYYEPNSPVPVWTDRVRDKWNGENLRTTDQVNDAMNALFWWRENQGLEAAIMFRRQLDMLWIPPLEPNFCSASTEDLYNIYVDYLHWNCCDDRPMNYYPLLDRIVEWMDVTYGEGKPQINWQVENFDDAPPAPIFNNFDSEYCQSEVNNMYDSAVSTFESSQRSEKQLNTSYQQILDRQKGYGIELVNNRDFERWTVSDWENSWLYEPNGPVPAWSDWVRGEWNGDNLRTTDQVNDAVYALFWWRQEYGLEMAIMFRRQLSMIWIPPLEVGVCSASTAQLYDIYTSYLYEGCCDDRPMNFYPLLDRIVEWMDTEYGA